MGNFFKQYITIYIILEIKFIEMRKYQYLALTLFSCIHKHILLEIVAHDFLDIEIFLKIKTGEVVKSF